MFGAGWIERDEISRRAILEYGARTFLGVSMMASLPALAADAPAGKNAAAAKPKPSGPSGPGTAKHVIFLCMSGAMSHIDTFDLKPGRETQGETKGISTSVPGMQFGNTLPRLAKVADHLAVVRSMSTKTGDHEQGRYLLRTSYKEIASIRHPALGAWAVKILGRQNDTLPDNVMINSEARHPGAGFLDPSFTPVPIGDPNAGLQNTTAPKYLTDDAFQKRMDLIGRFDAQFRNKFPQSQVEAYTEFYTQATKLMHSAELKAFDLNKEKDEVRNRYGRNRFGQGCLLARRLVEHNLRFIEVSLDGWDMHVDIYHNEKLPTVAGQLDTAVSALIGELDEKGLLDTTLIALGTEFGRSPRINANAGRDHHPGVFSVFFSGGGIRGGRFYGKSDEDGFRPDQDPLSIADFNATLAHALGLPLDKEFISGSGRPFKVANDGSPILPLFA